MTRMQAMKLVICAMLATFLATPDAVYADDGKVKCKADLDEAAEVPAPDPEFGTIGKAKVEFDADQAEATYRLRVNDGLRLFMAHIHCAPVGQTGPVIVWLAGRAPDFTGWNVDGNWIRSTALVDADVFSNIPAADNNCIHQIADLNDLANACLAGDCYVNVHSRDNPAGQIRGQLVCK